jgi:hypothetical protein
LLRAQHVIDKANRTGEDVSRALKEHMVSRSAITALLGDSYEYVAQRKKKRGTSEQTIIEWAKSHIGESTNPDSIAADTGLSYATANKVVQSRGDWFARVKRGVYTVRDPESERKADKAGG